MTSPSARHTIGVVARRTGLTPDVLRVWQRRYGAVVPERQPGGRRLYSEEQIERLGLLARLTELGHPIGTVAHLPTEDLGALLARDVPAPPEHRFLAECLEAVRHYRARDLEAAFERAAFELGRRELIELLLSPLMEQVGDLWSRGELGVAQEHLATAVVRSFASRLPALSGRSAEGGGPVLLVTTPSGERHELGALLVAATAGVEGWRPVYLGPDLPAHDIAHAAAAFEARAVAVSLTFENEPDRTRQELRELASALGKDTAILVGGRATERFRDTLDEIGATVTDGLGGLREWLAAVGRRP